MKTLSILVILLLFICLCNVKSKAQNTKDYQSGCYYDTSGLKHIGLINFDVSYGNFYDRLNFKISDSAKNQKVPIATVKSVLINSMPDTIRVYTEWDTATYERTQYFGQLCASTPNTRIYSRVHLKYKANGVDVWSMGVSGRSRFVGHEGGYGNSVYTETQYLYEIDGSLTLPIYRSNYREVLSKAFADNPDLVSKIKNKTLKFPDLKEIIEQYQSHKNQAKN